MSLANAAALFPLLVLAGASVVVMIVIAVRRSRLLTAVVSLLSLAVSFATLWVAARHVPAQVTPLLLIDRYALFYIGLILAAAFAVALMAYAYVEKLEGETEELYLLLLLATLGAGVLVASNHFASFFLGLELLSVALYALIAYPRSRVLSIEAGVKYLVLAAASAAFLLFGIALLYAQLGTLELARVALLLSLSGPRHDPLIITGLVFVVTGIGFKLAVVPFHMWTPDVYQGAPAPVTAFVATVSKGAMFALLVRYFYAAGIDGMHRVFTVFAVIAIASMFAGNVLALLQNNVKRILAYSSIAHVGYMLVAFQARGPIAVAAINFYLVAYFVTTLGAFAIVSALSNEEREADRLDDYRGLFWRRPALSLVFSVMLFSLAGIPLTAGFVAKFYVVAAGASSATWALIIVLVATSAIGLFYYLRIIGALFATETPSVLEAPRPLRVTPSDGLVLAALTFLLFWFGIYPTPLLRLIANLLPHS